MQFITMLTIHEPDQLGNLRAKLQALHRWQVTTPVHHPFVLPCQTIICNHLQPVQSISNDSKPLESKLKSMMDPNHTNKSVKRRT